MRALSLLLVLAGCGSGIAHADESCGESCATSGGGGGDGTATGAVDDTTEPADTVTSTDTGELDETTIDEACVGESGCDECTEHCLEGECFNAVRCDDNFIVDNCSYSRCGEGPDGGMCVEDDDPPGAHCE